MGTPRGPSPLAQPPSHLWATRRTPMRYGSSLPRFSRRSQPLWGYRTPERVGSLICWPAAMNMPPVLEVREGQLAATIMPPGLEVHGTCVSRLPQPQMRGSTRLAGRALARSGMHRC